MWYRSWLLCASEAQGLDHPLVSNTICEDVCLPIRPIPQPVTTWYQLARVHQSWVQQQ
jgi:hypothetical protein